MNVLKEVDTLQELVNDLNQLVNNLEDTYGVRLVVKEDGWYDATARIKNTKIRVYFPKSMGLKDVSFILPRIQFSHEVKKGSTGSLAEEYL